MKRIVRALCLLLTVVVLLQLPVFALAADADSHFDISIGSNSITIKDPAASNVDMTQPYAPIISNAKQIAQVIVGLCAVTSLIFFLINIAKLGTAGDNERLRGTAFKGILFSGLSLTMFGGLTVVVSLFWNLVSP